MMSKSEKNRTQWSNQPVESWLTFRELQNLLRPSFEIIEMSTLIHGLGQKGFRRIWNCRPLKALVSTLKTEGLFEAVRSKIRLGLHIVAVAGKIKY